MIEQDFTLNVNNNGVSRTGKAETGSQSTTRTRKTGILHVKPYVSKENMTKPINYWLNQKHKAISHVHAKI
jgi:hypothetical protein